MSGGILLLDKPMGLSSNDALQRVRRAFGRIKAGHTGTLDPLASGMLPICLGEATKLAGEIVSGRKCYRFTVQLGEARSTGDAEGDVVTIAAIPAFEPAFIQAIAATFTGRQLQTPPMYSALKRAGQPLYKLARKGVVVEREPRQITIDSLQLLQRNTSELEFRVICSKGTYVRVLAEDLARRAGTVGFVSALRREYVEPFEHHPMVTLDSLQADPLPALIPADQAALHLAAVHLTTPEAIAITQGKELSREPVAGAEGDQTVRLYDHQGQFFGLGALSAVGVLRAKRLYAS